MAEQMVCASCGSVGVPVRKTRGSFVIELALWLIFCAPGLVYSLWRLTTKHTACRTCGGVQLVPPGSPVGQRLLRERAG